MSTPNLAQTLSFACERIYQCWHLYAFCHDASLTLRYSSFPNFKPPESTFLSRQTLEKFYAKCQEKKVPLLLEEEQSIHFCGFLDETSHLYLLGPYSDDFINSVDTRRYARSHNVNQEDFSIPYLPINMVLPMLSLSCLIFTGNQYTEQEILQANTQGEDIFQKELTNYKLENHLQERQHLSYEFEQERLRQIEEGNFIHYQSEFTQPGLAFSDYPTQVGTMAKNPRKQTEYMIISALTLDTRAIIRGGVPPMEAYNLSDIYCQKVAECRTTLEIYKVFADAETGMSRLVQAYKKHNSNNYYVEKCKDYIGSHLHDKLELTTLAGELGVSPAWLSRLFSREEGMGLSRYILMQRLTAARNMLKYSPASVGEIADYLCFSSQSHFGKCFKKEYGITPGEYRNHDRGNTHALL